MPYESARLRAVQITPPTAAELKTSTLSDKTLLLELYGRLDVQTIGQIWSDALGAAARHTDGPVVVGVGGVDYCDTAGIALMLTLRRKAREADQDFEIQGMTAELRDLMQVFAQHADKRSEPPPRSNLFVKVGRAAAALLGDMREIVTFVGAMSIALPGALLKPHRIRWRELAGLADRVGASALPIVALIGFLLGLIMAFQSAIPLQQFALEVYVSRLVGLSVIRELGPLMTAIILAGRSGSSFAAEIGTMKVNEELDALETMGLEPVRFLAVPRVLAVMAMAPLLTVYFNLLGLVGGGVVVVSLGYPVVTYRDHILEAVGTADLVGGLIKALVFGLLVAGVGCLRGLQTETGPSAVGDATTRAVVSGIVLIALADGVFSVIYYYLGV